MPSAAPTARLEARISIELHAMLKRAAEIQGRTLTDFVVSAVQEATQRAIKQGEVVRLSLADSERFAQALLSPPDPSPALERAFARRRKLLRPTLKAQPSRLSKRLPSPQAPGPRRTICFFRARHRLPRRHARIGFTQQNIICHVRPVNGPFFPAPV